MKKLRLWTATLLLAATLFLAITQQGHADSDRLSINANGMVRLVYFLPSDRPYRSDSVTGLGPLTKDAQRVYADRMHKHGFGGKTFTIETDTNGKPLIHQVKGKFTEEYYFSNTGYKVWSELRRHFDEDDLQHIYFVAIDLSIEVVEENAGGVGGVSFYPVAGSMGFDPTGRIYLRNRDFTNGEEVHGGLAVIPASGINFGRFVTVHELGHVFGLEHDDYREGRTSDYVMAGGTQNRLSKCAAEWLSVSRFFNTKTTFLNEPGEIQLVSLQAYSQDAINFRFEVADPDGLHHAQLLVPSILENPEWAGRGPYRLFDCKPLSGKTGIVESAVRTAELVDRITLQIIDVGGNITWATFAIQLEEAVSAQNVLDVNSDGVVNVFDLTPVASHFGFRGKSKADVNGDGVIDIVDLLLVAAAPIYSLPQQAVETFTAAEIQRWLTDVEQVEVQNAILKHGIIVLESLLEALTYQEHTDYVRSVAFSSDSQMLASGSSDRTVRLWDVATEQLLHTFLGHTGDVMSVAFSPDGQTLASGSWDRTIHLWNPNTGQLKRTLNSMGDGVASIAFSPDGQTLASGGANQPILLWNTTTGQVERKLTEHTNVVDAVAFSPDGAILASGSRDQTIRLWNPNTGQLLHTLTEHRSEVNRLVFSSDGETLASGGWDGIIRLWNTDTGTLKRTLPNQGGWANTMAFSPDGKTLTIGNRGISLWDLETGQYKEPLAEDIGNAVSVVFSPDGTMLASGSGDGKVRLWDFTPFLITPGLSKISGDNQTGVSGGVLTNPFVVKVRDENLSVRKGISVTFTVTAGDGTLSATRTTTDENGRAESILTLGQNPGTNTVSVSAAGIEGTVTFNAVAGAPVDIPDANLRAAIETALKVSPGTPIISSEMETLTRLEAQNTNISDLTGLEGATNLTTLNLGHVYEGGRPINSNSLSNISLLAGLTNLTELRLGFNLIENISPLAGLTNLTFLDITGNSVSNIAPVANLTKLTHLDLDGNTLSDISPVTGLTNLTFLDIWGTPISDISPVAGLTNLTTLGLGYNSISDISPLIANTGLGKGDEVYVQRNPLSYQSIYTHIPALQSRGVTVEFDNRTPTSPLKISGDDQQGTSGTALERPFVVEVRDADGSAFEGVPVTFTVTAGGGTLSVTSTKTDANGRAESTLTLRPAPGTNTVTVSVTGIQKGQTFNAEGLRIPMKLEIISGTDQEGLPSEALEKPFVVEVRDQTDKPLPGVEVTFTVTIGDGTLSATITTTDENGRAESTLTLGPNPGTNTVEATVTGIEEKRTFTAEGIRIPKTLEIISGVDQEGLPGDALEKAFVVEVRDQFDKPLPGVEVTFSVSSGDGTLGVTSATTDSNGRVASTLTLGPNLGKNSVRVSVEGISESESFTAVGIRPQFDLSLPAGISLIHIPLRVTAVDDAPLTIESMSDLYDALGGAEKVNFLVTHDAQQWRVYFGSQNRGTSGDKALTDDLGIIAAMKDAVTIRLGGDSLGRDGNSTITLHRGTNLVGVPLRDSRIMRVSDLLSLEGIRGNVPSIFVSVQGKFVEVRRAADDGNISITGGQSFVLEARDAATVAISGNAWYNTSGTTAAPAVAVTGIEVGDVTPVLAFSGSIVDEVRVWSGPDRDVLPTGSGFRVTVKNLSTSKAVTAVTGDEHVSSPDKGKLIGVGYQLAVVDMESGRAARVGDVLEVSAKTSNPLIRVRSLRYTVTAADVKNSRIQLPELVAYEIPAETALLPNYPNPFNPETWIPYQLAEDADVTLTIYNTRGVTVRRLDLGHQLAGYYTDRGKATYWNGRNDNGESVASGLYFYQLGTLSFSQIRRMVIVK